MNREANRLSPVVSRRGVVLVIASLMAVALAPQAPADEGEGSENFRSELHSVQPTIEGLSVSVVDGDDALELENGTGLSILVPGYAGEPYLRFGAGGKVEVNVNSPAKYLNEDRYAQVDVPKTAGEKKPPKWAVVARQGVYEWHEHRIHWMSTTTPPQVKDEGEESKVFDWTVPLQVGGQTVKVSGTLFWDPHDDATSGGGFPTVPVVAGGLAALLVALAAGYLFARRRRGGGSPPSEAW
jgi:hypothetical protein